MDIAGEEARSVRAVQSRQPPVFPPFAMNRRVVRQILIALGVFAGIILLFVAIAQVTG
ncbi:hypothetical protein SRU_2763 [Salinibacter ruber DSM 13855]|uniref:Uncharacterized protein n=3 Tax=Salinibacter ruber TaxID=146919 RepID=Q2RYX6_SALRD|nr:hypothetical protein SRU_2763 [Salinibacter ruber DSM 13855]CBH25896.1 conserved hypothetical protein [Salinibacter ruber M8]